MTKENKTQHNYFLERDERNKLKRVFRKMSNNDLVNYLSKEVDANIARDLNHRVLTSEREELKKIQVTLYDQGKEALYKKDYSEIMKKLKDSYYSLSENGERIELANIEFSKRVGFTVTNNISVFTILKIIQLLDKDTPVTDKIDEDEPGTYPSDRKKAEEAKKLETDKRLAELKKQDLLDKSKSNIKPKQ